MNRWPVSAPCSSTSCHCAPDIHRYAQAGAEGDEGIRPDFRSDLKPLQPKPKPEQSKGGGGSPQKTAVTKGELPKVAPKSFVPRFVRRKILNWR